MAKFTKAQAEALTIQKAQKITTDGVFKTFAFRVIDEAEKKAYEFNSNNFGKDNQLGADATKDDCVSAVLKYMRTIERKSKSPIHGKTSLEGVEGNKIKDLLTK